MDQGLVLLKRALLSVSDKTDIVDLARYLSGRNIELVSTGGTAEALRRAELRVTNISTLTNFPEMFEGRLKTLHPKVHGSLLFKRDNGSHIAQAKEHGMAPIDLLVVNLYPFEEVLKKRSITMEECVENIDIGGPAMIRAAAKNFQHVAVVTEPKEYIELMFELDNSAGCTSVKFRKDQAAKAYNRTALYDAEIGKYLTRCKV